MNPKPRVLVIRGGAIGDFILTLPALRLLRESLPGCHLEVLGYPGIAPLAVKAGLADSVRDLEHRTMAPLFAKQTAIAADVAAYLRSFSLVVSYLYDPDEHFRASLERAGVKTLIEASHRVEAGHGHAAAQLARPLERLAMFLEDPGARLFAAKTPRTCGNALRIAIHPGSGSEKKNWPLERWLQVAAEIAAAYPAARLCFITGEAEAERGMLDSIQKKAAALACEHWHGLALTELADRLHACDLFLGHDSGISHLAAACGAQCLLLFGPTDPATWAPANPQVIVIHEPAGDLSQLGLDAVREQVHAMLENVSKDCQPCVPVPEC